MRYTFDVKGNKVSFRAGTENGYDAAFDGKKHPAKSSLITAVQIERVDARTIVVRQDHKTFTSAEVRYTVSEDGQTLTSTHRAKRPDGRETNSKQVFRRISGGGGDPLSGTWESLPEQGVSADGPLTVTYAYDAGTLTYTRGQITWSAKIDGPAPAGNGASVRKIDDHTFEETYYRDGKATGVARITVSPDSKKFEDVTTLRAPNGAERKIIRIFERQ